MTTRDRLIEQALRLRTISETLKARDEHEAELLLDFTDAVDEYIRSKEAK